jgi:hypothetical protein
VNDLYADIVIDAPAPIVWEIFSDFAAYPEWNPFIPSLSGEPAVGNRLAAFIKPQGQRGMAFRPRVLVAEPGRELTWLGSVLFRGLLDGEHRFRIEEIGPNRTRFTQSERFTGILAPLFRGMLAPAQAGFEAMNAALKARAESRVSPGVLA